MRIEKPGEAEEAIGRGSVMRRNSCPVSRVDSGIACAMLGTWDARQSGGIAAALPPATLYQGSALPKSRRLPFARARRQRTIESKPVRNENHAPQRP